MSDAKMKMEKCNRWLATVLLTLTVSPAWAQGDEHAGHAPPAAVPAPAESTNQGAMPGMDHSTMPGMDHGAMSAPPKETGAMPPMDHSGHTAVQPAAASSELRDPHAYSGGYDFSQFPMRHEGGAMKFGMLRADRLETARSDGDAFSTWDVQASYGGDFDRALLKTEGDIAGGDVEDVGTELLWSHAVAPFWNTQLGVRYDSGAGPDRSWLAFGVQGLAPYWFEVDATAYLGENGRTALGVEAEYELLLTQKLILQPRVEVTAHGKEDTAHGAGAGLSDLAAGLRLRYEIRREFAPYIGVEWSGKFGATADFARAAGVDRNETRAVAGVRFWF